MSTTSNEIKLSPGYRQAQRAVAASLEHSGGHARRAAFAARTALAGLDPVEQARLAHWLAWQCLAARSQDRQALLPRIQRLDAALARLVQEHAQRLPIPDGRAQPMRRSA